MLFDWTQCLYELSIRDEDCNVIRDFIQKFHDVSAYVPSSGELEKKTEQRRTVIYESPTTKTRQLKSKRTHTGSEIVDKILATKSINVTVM